MLTTIEFLIKQKRRARFIAAALIVAISTFLPCVAQERNSGDVQAVLSPTNSATVKEALQIVDQARELLQRGNHRDAEPLLRRALLSLEVQRDKDEPSIALVLSGLGATLFQAAKFPEAEQVWRRALLIRESHFGPEHAETGRSLNNLATLLRRLERNTEAESLLRRALAILEKTYGSEHQSTAVALNNLAELLVTTGRHTEAEPHLRRALAIHEKTVGPDHSITAQSLNSLAEMLGRTGRIAEAEQLLRRALAIVEKTFGSDHPGAAPSLSNLANLLNATGRNVEAEPLRRRTLTISEKTYGQEHPATAQALSLMARSLGATGRFEEAEPFLRRALAINEKAFGPDHASTASTLGTLANLLNTTGRYAEAEPMMRRALAITEKSRGAGHADTASRLNSLGHLLQTTGRYSEAELLYRRALAVYEKTLGPEHVSTANSIIGLANLFTTTGRYVEAEPLYRRALVIHEKSLGLKQVPTANGMTSLANLFQTMGRFAEAESLYRQALAIHKGLAGTGDVHTAVVLTNLGELLGQIGQIVESEACLREALLLFEKTLGPDHASTASVLNSLSVVLCKSDRCNAALGLSQRSVNIGSLAGDPSVLWESLNQHASVHKVLGQPELAIFYGKQAVNTLQKVRVTNKGLSDEAQKGFLKKNESNYSNLADLLISEGRLVEAQQVMTMLKQDEYFDFVRRTGKDDRDISLTLTSSESAWRIKLDNASIPLATLGKEKAALDRLRKGGLRVEEERRLEVLENTLKVARKDFTETMQQIVKEAKAYAGTGAMRVGSEALESLRAWRGTLKELGEGTVLLQYVITTEKLWIILTTSEIQVARASTISAAELNKQVFDFRKVLSSPTGNPQFAAERLYKLMIAPVADELAAANAKTLMVSLDGSLRYVPVAALHDGKGYLVERYRTPVLTEAAKTQIAKKPATNWTMAGLGLTHAVAGFEALPGVKDEMDGLIRSAPSNRGVLSGEVYLDSEFTSRRLQQLLSAQEHPVLHVASHFHFTPAADAESFLVLGDGSRLTLREIRDSDLRFDHVDLLTFSACETAVGDNSRGREVEGLGALAQKQGAKAVLATLWPVADTSTGLFMRQLYKLRNDSNLNKAEAMRQAQLGFLKSDPSYSHPFYWAPFVLMGNWL